MKYVTRPVLSSGSSANVRWADNTACAASPAIKPQAITSAPRAIPIRYVRFMPADPPFVIRRATEIDAPALGRLGALLMRVHHSFDPQRFLPPGSNPEAGYGRFLKSQLRDEDSVVLVAEREGAVVGYVFASLEPLSWKELRDACGYIHDVAVEEAGRRLGVATALIEAAVEWLRSRGAP